MVLPLYYGLPLLQFNKNLFNTGLWYNKYCNTWSESKNEPKKWELGAPEKLAWMNTVAKAIGPEKILANAINRQIQLTVARQGTCLAFRTDSRFATGLGLEHPVEIGFLWHPNFGVPYIPGSTIKGMIREWALSWQGVEASEVYRVFGSSDSEGAESVGTVIFFDALPMGQIKLETDVMTPHYGPHYQENNKEKEPPADWHSPTPIYFLTVAAGQRFLFSVAPRKEKDQQDVNIVIKWLKEALSEIGIGGKTAVGYGRFNYIGDESKEYREKIRQAREEAEQQEKIQANPVFAEMLTDGYDSLPEDVFVNIIKDKWAAKLNNKETSQKEKTAIADLLATWFQKNKPKQWKKPNAKNRVTVQKIKECMSKI